MPSAKCQVLESYVWVLQVSFDCEIFAELMQTDGLHAGRVVDACESSPSGERNGGCACENPGCVVQKNFVDDARGKRGPVDHGTTFDHQASDLHLAKQA